jgi:hypothetical protein
MVNRDKRSRCGTAVTYRQHKVSKAIEEVTVFIGREEADGGAAYPASDGRKVSAGSPSPAAKQTTRYSDIGVRNPMCTAADRWPGLSQDPPRSTASWGTRE